MGITSIFIKRPVATVLLTIALCAAGAIAYALLPVAALPQVDFPTISVRASMPGASPRTMASSVATPLERALGSIAGITEMTSVSAFGSTRVIIQFDLNRDINGAARDVQAAINASLSDLPAGLSRPPSYHLVNPADAPIMLLALTSDTIFPQDLYDLASNLLTQKIAQVDGVGEVDVGGGSLPAVRVEVNTDELHQYGLSLGDVASAIRSSNSNIPRGALEEGDRYWQIASDDRFLKAADYAPLVVRWKNNAPVRLEDVAAITDSVENINNMGMVDGNPAVMLAIFRKPGANIIATADAVKALLPRLAELIPPDVEIHQILDRTTTIRASLRDMTRSLGISLALVVLVVFFFLRAPRATFIPSLAVSASLIGTFAGMYLCGFSLDNFSLMALVVATGLVVDDAIVVVENISRHLEKGMTPMRAAMLGAREVSFTVLSISLSLVAVFIPILLMEGIVGRLFREFAVTLAIAIGISLTLSLTLTPMLCAHLLKSGRRKGEPGAAAPDSGKKAPGFFSRLSRRLDGIQNALQLRYAASLRWVLRHRRMVLHLWFGTVALTIFLYIIAPKGFFPQQDTGMIRGSLRADESISFQTLRAELKELMDIVGRDPAVATVAGYTRSNSSAAFVSIGLKPRAERGVSADEVIARLRPQVGKGPGAQLFMSAAQDIRVGGRASRAAYQYTLRADDLDDLRIWADRLQTALRDDPMFKDVNSDLEDGGLEVMITTNRSVAGRLGVTMRDVGSALGNAFGQSQVSTMYRERNQYHVVLIAEKRHWQGPEGLNSVYVPGSGGGLIPLHGLAEFSVGRSPVSVNHQSQVPAVTVSFNLAPGAALSEAAERIEEVKRAIAMPSSVRATFQGTAKVFQDSLRNEPWLILAALVCLYIVLGILYESCIHPITALSTLPPAGIGALLALSFCGMDFSIIALVGVLLLAGIVKKNAILLIDFAIMAERANGLSPEESITMACALRFRPIMMTTMAAMLGAVPLAVGFGDGAELRRPLGVSIIGGLALSQILTLYTTPVLYLYLDSLRDWWAKRVKPPLKGEEGGKLSEETA